MMKYKKITLSILALLYFVILWHEPLHAQPRQAPMKGYEEIVIQETWQGDFPVSQLNLLPENQREQPTGYIDTATLFASIWKAFKPDENLPEIDFNTSMVLFVRNTQFYNRISISRIMLKNGIAEILAMETMSALPIEDKVAMALAVVSQKGIRGIKVENSIILIIQ